MPTQRQSTKRSKTFTGCWTCRERGVKCDLLKPACNRCTRTKRICSGYGIRLVWVGDDDTTIKHAQRRMFDENQRFNPVFSDDHLTAALEDLDALVAPHDLHIPPFSIFQVRLDDKGDHPTDALQASDEVPQSWRQGLDAEEVDPLQYEEDVEVVVSNRTQSLVSQQYTTAGRPVYEKHQSPDLKTKILPMLPQFLASASADERRLFQYWVTHLSGSFLAMAALDNPFRDILIPLALQSALGPAGFSGHAALLQIIYAAAATHWSQRDPSQTRIATLAVKHYGACLPLLSRSLMERSEGQCTAIIAAVILISTIEVITGTNSTWRMHIKGGREWLKLQDSCWKQSSEASVLCQVFECLDLLGHSQGSLADLTRGIDTEFGGYDISNFPRDLQDGCGDGSEYCLDRYYGIPRPAYNAISAINRLRLLHHFPEPQQLERVETLISLAKPDILEYQAYSGIEQERQYHYAWVYHYACQVYLWQEFPSNSSRCLQTDVRQALSHIQAINHLEKASELCGLLWPTFVLACEAREPDLRHSFVNIFNDLEALAFGGYQTTAKVVKQMWKNKDSATVPLNMHRRQIFLDPEFDLLLT